MNIIILGAGAMGLLFGSKLSSTNNVTLVDINHELVDAINSNGVTVCENGCDSTYYPRAVSCSDGMEPADLIIIFVKTMFSRSALELNKSLIGPDTYVMTLQNGAGHEGVLLEFVRPEHAIIGTTQHNSSILSLARLQHGGAGHTYIGSPVADTIKLEAVASTFSMSGIETSVSNNVQKLIWEKIFTNVSASALTAVLQCPLGFICSNDHAWSLCSQLIQEAVEVVKVEGFDFDFNEQLASVRAVCENAPNGYTSIYSDMRNGRKTEVDAINGAVVRASRHNGTFAHTHEIMVRLIHALEDSRQLGAQNGASHKP